MANKAQQSRAGLAYPGGIASSLRTSQ